jgi:ribose transport system ATP-binding protein
MQQPKILILDEATAALASDTTDAFLPLLGKLAQRGWAIVYISHRLIEIQTVTKRVLAMRNGRIVADLPIAEASREKMVELVGGGTEILELASAASSMAQRQQDERPIALSASHLSGKLVADVDLEVRFGEIVGIAGLQGAGRSELLRLLCGLQQPSSGMIDVLGGGPCTNLRDATRRGVGYLAEGRGRMTFPNLDALSNLTVAALSTIGPRPGLVGKKREHSRTASLWSRLRIKGAPDTLIGNLSGGNQQRIFLGRWLLKDSRLLILDEPTAGVDVNSRDEFHSFLRELAVDGVAIILASAEPEEVAMLCNRVVILVAGRNAHEMSQPLDSAKVVAASYLGH